MNKILFVLIASFSMATPALADSVSCGVSYYVTASGIGQNSILLTTASAEFKKDASGVETAQVSQADEAVSYNVTVIKANRNSAYTSWAITSLVPGSVGVYASSATSDLKEVSKSTSGTLLTMSLPLKAGQIRPISKNQLFGGHGSDWKLDNYDISRATLICHYVGSRL